MCSGHDLRDPTMSAPGATPRRLGTQDCRSAGLHTGHGWLTARQGATAAMTERMTPPGETEVWCSAPPADGGRRMSDPRLVALLGERGVLGRRYLPGQMMGLIIDEVDAIMNAAPGDGGTMTPTRCRKTSVTGHSFDDLLLHCEGSDSSTTSRKFVL